MAGNDLSPGVQVFENNISQSIPTVTSSVGAMVMHSVKGPVNELTTLTQQSDLVNIFGQPNDVNFTHFFTANAFLANSNNLQVVRVEQATKACAGLTVGLSATGMGNIVLSTDTTKEVQYYPLNYSVIDLNEAKINYGLPAGIGAGDLDNATNALFAEDVFHVYGVGPGTYYDNISVTFLNAADFSTLLELKTALAEVSNASDVDAIADMYYNGTPATTAMSANDYLSNSLIKYDVLTPPTDGGDWFINSGMLATLTSFEYGPVTSDEAIMIVWNEFGAVAEQYVFSNIVDKQDPLGNPMFGPTLVNGNSAYVYFFIGNSAVAAAGLPMVTLNQTALGGADLLTGETPGSSLADLTPEILTQLEANFSNVEELAIDILLDPDYPDVVKRYLDSLASQIRLDCMAVLNVPLSYMLNPTNYQQVATPYTNMKNYVANTLNINSTYSAIYGNYFLIYDQYNNKNRWVPSSGYVAAVYAYTDFSAAQWYAPAGINRGIISNVIDVAVNPNKGQRDILYYNRINAIVKFQGQGIVVWGQKTMTSVASAFDRVNVRRLFLYLERVITNLSQQFLFEFNDSFSQSRFRGIVNPILASVQASRGVYDFLVVCDSTNNPPVVVDANEFHGDIFIKPARAIEYIKLSFNAVATGVSFSELLVNTSIST